MTLYKYILSYWNEEKKKKKEDSHESQCGNESYYLLFVKSNFLWSKFTICTLVLHKHQSQTQRGFKGPFDLAFHSNLGSESSCETNHLSGQTC